ncbi:tetratricopeptide repeat protein [Massilia sp. BJB1822]|uniref:tetratricopeptide repeat protein n=1 Tax=Massilia sp. BJB1822 TaxID=2744470 RepID=UPI001594340B|nr:tetratricopeptide repeat protein [Massilia sp. BJB1822]NVD99870.1 sel1 repeat family protein [Massilia sp. BJB1822]
MPFSLPARAPILRSFIFAVALGYPLLPHAAPPARFDKELQLAAKAWQAGEYDRAYSQYLHVSRDSHVAQFFLGLFQQNGWGRPRNAVQACRWFERAAAGKVPAAQHYLGDCLVAGRHRAVDIPAALDLYQSAANSGHLGSLCAMAKLYMQGKLVPQDTAQALELYTQAAQAGVPEAMLGLGKFYSGAEGGGADPALAQQWYLQAAQHAVPEAQYQLGLMLGKAGSESTRLKQALFWLESAATQGWVDAYLATAIQYSNSPVDPATGMLPPETLAKVYLWTAAAKARSHGGEVGAVIARLELGLERMMPASWRPDLDKQVAAHLAKFPQ